jgi:hypothetical protein
MKNVRQSIIIIILVLMQLSISAMNLRTRGSGNWNTVNSWQTDFWGFWSNSTITIPSSNDDQITIRTGHTITVNQNITIDELTIQTNATLLIPSNITLTIRNGAGVDILNNGNIVLDGTLIIENNTSIINNSSFLVNGTIINNGNITNNSTLSFSTNSEYVHYQNGGVIPTAVWDVNSHCNITGVTNTVPDLTSFGQNFGNFTWNSTNQNADISLAGNLTNIFGNFTIASTGSRSLRLLDAASIHITTHYRGDFTISGGHTYLYGTNTGLVGGSNTINIDGDFNITGDTNARLYINGNSDASSSATINLNGNFSMTGGRIYNNSNGTANFNFTGSSVQSFYKTNDSNAIRGSNAINFSVASGSTIDMGTSELTDNGNNCTFTLNSNATIISAHADGINYTGNTGSIQTSGSRDYISGANYIFNGTTNQVTGSGISQNTPRSITFSNSSTVSLSGDIVVSESINITTGTLNTSNSDYNITIGTNFTNNGNFVSNNSSVFFNGSTQSEINGISNTAFYNLIINKDSEEIIVSNINRVFSAFNNLSVIQGTLNMDAIDGNYIIENNLTISSNGTLSHNVDYTTGNSLEIKNDVIIDGVFSSTNGEILLSGTTSQTLSGTKDSFTFHNLNLNNSSGFITNIPIYISNNITFTNGIIETNNLNYITILNGATTNIGNENSYINGPLFYEMAFTGTRTLNFPIGKDIDWRPIELELNHSDATSYTYKAEVINESPSAREWDLPATSTNISTTRYWSIKRYESSDLSTHVSSAGLNGNQTITLYYGENDGVTDPDFLSICKTNGESWIDIGGIGATISEGKITSTSAISEFTGFSDFTLANTDGGSNPLPIELSSFTAKNYNEGVLFEWTTQSETNNDFFTIEYSKNGIDFFPITNINGNGTTPITNNYEYFDASLSDFGLIYFRLKQTDYDGEFSYSNIISLYVENEIVDITIYPNPTSEYVILKYSNTTIIENIKITDSYNRSQTNVIDDNKINVSSLSPGVYYLHISTGYSTIIKSFIKL